MPMQPLTAPPRHLLSEAQVTALLRDEESIVLSGGLEVVDLDLQVVEDISGDLAGGRVERNSYATMHGSAQFSISRVIDWGGDLLRPYLTVSAGDVGARFNLGVYHPTTPAWPLHEFPPTFSAEGYDILLRLNQPVGDAYAIAAGDSYLTRVQDIITGRGYTRFIIDQSAAATVAPRSRVWAFDDQITWLTIVNELLGSVGYAGLWSDWDGWLRAGPYQRPIDREAEWIYTDDPAQTMLSTRRSVERDYFAAPNRWVIYRSNLGEQQTPVEGDGIYTYTNQAIGDTSVAARRGLVITRTEGVDAADQGALVAQAQSIIDADMHIPQTYHVETSPNPLHWHFDRLFLRDSAGVGFADAMCTSWSMPLPPEQGDMRQQWTILAAGTDG